MTDRSGIVLYTENGGPVEITLMAEDDENLQLREKLEEGVYAYQGPETNVTLFLEDPEDGDPS